jgi:hypothetical protein
MTNEDKRLERLVATVENVCNSLAEVTVELRATNESVNKMSLDLALMGQTVDNHGKEIFAGDNSSRIRTLEMQMRGVFALGGFIALTLGGNLLAILSHSLFGFGVGK